MLNPATLLDSLADTLEALDTTAYRYAASDAWRRGRFPVPEVAGGYHLEFWPILGAAALQARDRIDYDLTIRFLARTQAEDDFLEIGRAHTAALSALNALDRWTNQGTRCTGLAYEVTQAGPAWAVIEITGTLIVSDWR
jgi:hypothetical protein